MTYEAIKYLLLQSHYNDLFEAIQNHLPPSEALQIQYYTLKNKWLHPDANFNEHTWKQQMLELIKLFFESREQETKRKDNPLSDMQQALAEADLDKFIKLLKAEPNFAGTNLAIGFMARYHALQRDIHSSILSRDEIRIEQRRLEQAALYLIEQLQSGV